MKVDLSGEDKVLSSVIDMVTKERYSGKEPPEPPMELTERVAKLETSMISVMTDVAVIRANYATREDLHKEISSQTWKFVTYTTSMFVTVTSALVAASYLIAKHIG